MGHHLAVVLWRLEQNSNRIFAHATPVSELHAAVPSSQPEVRRPAVKRRSSLVPLQIPRDAAGSLLSQVCCAFLRSTSTPFIAFVLVVLQCFNMFYVGMAVWGIWMYTV